MKHREGRRFVALSPEVFGRWEARKAVKARDLGVQRLSWDDFLAMVDRCLEQPRPSKKKA